MAAQARLLYTRSFLYRLFNRQIDPRQTKHGQFV